MKRIRGDMLGIDQGSTLVFSDFEDGGEMWTGSGPRERRCAVRFSEPFQAPPAVSVGVSLWDVDSSSNLRADIAAEAVTCDGFEIVFHCWGDTRVARIRADWTAIGALKDDDLWQL
ncbi:H-type lectin domain-containing protein [Acidimangrovimonas pyrenivorans]|uniref:H-type lectin domain-containing protein n=1 Tax=Acidimangrovimonas pyrenivorans TaxID=2030798 RepID=A0ABV7ALE9_9RHOB